MRLYFLHSDHLGRANYVTDEYAERYTQEHNGTLVEVAFKDGNDNPFKFNAKELDSETGLYYYGATYYIFTVAIQKGQDLGQISDKTDARVLARFIFNNYSGIRVLTRSGKKDKQVYNDIVKAILSLL